MVVTPEEFRDRYGIDARILHEVTEIDLKERRLHVRDLKEGKEHREAFDLLMIATGLTSPYRHLLVLLQMLQFL